jgi:hypothetical protein
MTAKELSAIGKKLTHSLPDFAVSGPVIFKIEPEGILLGLHFGSSSRDGRILRLNAFLLPLFVPTETIHFNYGKRIGSGTGQWNGDDPNLIDGLTESIRIEAIPFFKTVSTLQGVVEFIRPMVVPNANGYVNPHSQEALAYTLVKLNDVDGAMAMLNQIQKSLSKSAVPWELDIRTRTQLIEEKLLPKPEAALAQLEAWKAETIGKLRLEKHR